MSYCRWSSLLHAPGLTMQEWVKSSPAELAKKYNTELSDWYIFWHTSSGDSRDEQLLAIWHKNDIKHRLYNYESVLDMFKNNDWSELENVTQVEFLRNCVEDWLIDVNREFGEK